jgi:hypothetical protein
MNPHRKFKNRGPDGFGLVLMFLILCFIGFVVIVIDPVHKKSIEKLSEPPLITCRQCKGTGEYPTDINKLMMDASLVLFINKHLMVDKCKKCVKLPHCDGYEYCDTVESKYKILLKEYAAAGPNIDIAACSECMGMGRFTCQRKDGTYKTQKEYDAEHTK